MATYQVDEENFQEKIEEAFNTNKKVILKFESEFCDACMAQGFELEELEELRDDVDILEIDCSESEQLVEHYNINQVPTMMIFKDRETLLYDEEGVILASDIVEILDS
jgi:thioredoxin 1